MTIELLQPHVLVPWLLGMVFGIFVGSTPGLTATMAVAVLLSTSDSVIVTTINRVSTTQGGVPAAIVTSVPSATPVRSTASKNAS